jgi:predicted PurR-regulated permease PerM
MSDLAAPRAPKNVATRAVLLAAALIVAGLLFKQLVALLLAVLIMVIIAIPISGIATRLERFKVPRWLGAMAALLAGLAVVGALLALLIPPFVEQTREFVEDVPGAVKDLQDRFREATGAGPSRAGTDVQDYLQSFVDQPAKLIRPITSIGLGIAGALASLVLVLVTAYYVAVKPQPLVDGALRLFPPPRRAWASRILERLRQAYIGWLRGVAVDMVVTFVLLYAGLTVIGLDFALVFAVFSAFLVVIPYFGAFIAGIPPILFALADSPSKALLALVVYVATQQIEGNVIIPIVMSRQLKLHPAVIAIGVVVVGKLFGFVGLFVAVPILSTIFILSEEMWVRSIEQADEERRMPEGLELPAGAELEQPPEPRSAAPARS